MPGCAPGEDATDGAGPAADTAARTVRFGTGTQMVTFDPHLADTGPQYYTYLTLVYDGLTHTNVEDLLKPFPGLAASWSWRDDRTIDLFLRRGVRFIDGEPFDAHAAKANIDRLFALEGPRINTVASIDAAEVLDDHTLRLRLHYPDPTLLYNLSHSPGLMVSPAAFDNPDLDLNPVGTGPWIYDRARSTHGEVHRFVPNPDYFLSGFDDAPPLDIHLLVNIRARLNAMISGQIDVAIVTPAEAAPAREAGFAITSASNRWFGITILDRAGELVPELGDPRVRQALGFAVERQAIADTVFFGYARPTSQPMAAGNLGHDPDLEGFFSYDPDRARALLDEAGVDTFTFTIPVSPNGTAAYEAVQAYLQRVGIDMRIAVIDGASIGADRPLPRVSGECDRLSELRSRQPPSGDLVRRGRLQPLRLRGLATRAAGRGSPHEPGRATARAELPRVLRRHREGRADRRVSPDRRSDHLRRGQARRRPGGP